jgi:predicted nucleic acid-binding protein
MLKALSSELDPGEAEAIVLALEIKAEQVLIDERRGRMIAARLNLHYTGILGILVEAKSQGFIYTVKPLLDDLINKAGFWVAEPLYKSVLRLVNETK